MLYKPVDLFNNLSFGKKIMTAFLLLVIFSNSIGGIVVIYILKQSVEKKSIQYEQELTIQISNIVDTYLKQIDKLSIQAGYNQSILEFLGKKYDKSSASQVEYVRDRDSVFTILNKERKIVDGIENIVIYNNDGMPFCFYQMGEPNPDYDVRTENWYEKVLDSNDTEFKIFVGVHKSNQFGNTKKSIVSIIRRIKNLQNFKGIGIIKIDMDVEVFAELIQDNGQNSQRYIYLLDDKGRIIYSNKSNRQVGEPFDKDIFYHIQNDNLNSYIKKTHNDQVLINQAKSNYSGWYIVTRTEKMFMTEDSRNAIELFFMAWIISAVIALVLSIIISNGIVRPIKILESNIVKIEEGNFDNTIEWNSRDEIGLLAISFNRMSKRLKQLIDEIYSKEAEKRKAEIAALQAQINPHFVFNTLNTIKYMAILQRANGVVDMLDAFITLTRAVSKSTTELVKIEEEIRRIKSYVYIEETRYCGKFNVEFEYDEEVLEYKTLGFILQPIVENAIFHGIEPKIERDKIDRGKVKISITRKQEHIEFCIEDNGVGMEQSVIDRNLNSDEYKRNGNSSIGINNVNKRVKLYFGDEYGVNIESTVNIGSKVRISIPAVL